MNLKVTTDEHGYPVIEKEGRLLYLLSKVVYQNRRGYYTEALVTGASGQFVTLSDGTSQSFERLMPA